MTTLPTWLLGALDLDEKEGKSSPLRYPPTERYSIRTGPTPRGGESQLLDPVTGRPRPAFQGGEPGLVPPPFTERYRRTKQRRPPSASGTRSDTSIPEHVLSEDLLAGPVIPAELTPYDRYLSAPDGRPWAQGQSGPSYDIKNRGWISEEDTRKIFKLEPVWGTPDKSLFTMTDSHIGPSRERVPLPGFRGGLPAYELSEYEDRGNKDLSKQFADDLVEGKRGFANGGKSYVVETGSGELIEGESEAQNMRQLVGRPGTRRVTPEKSTLPSWLQSAINPENSKESGDTRGSTEKGFQKWYASWADKIGLDPDPDSPAHHYDYRAAFKAGVSPKYVENTDKPGWYWPSDFKKEDSQRRFLQEDKDGAFEWNGRGPAYDTIKGEWVSEEEAKRGRATPTPAGRARKAAELQSRLAIPGGLPGTTADPQSDPAALLGDQGLVESTWKGTLDPIADASQRGFHGLMKSGFGAAEFLAQTSDPKLKEPVEKIQRWARDSADAEQRIIEAATDPNRPGFRERFSADPVGTIVEGAAEALPALAGYVGLGSVAPAALPAVMFGQGAGATYASTREEGADPVASTLAAATSGAVNAALGAVQIERIFSGLGPAGASVVDRLKHLMVTGLIGAGTTEVQTVADSAVHAAATAEEDGRLAAAQDAVVAGADVDSVLEIMVPGFVASVAAGAAVGGRGEAEVVAPAEDGGAPLPPVESAAPVPALEAAPPPTPQWLAEQGGRIAEQSNFIDADGNRVDRKMIDFRPSPEEILARRERDLGAREFERRVLEGEDSAPDPEWVAKYGDFEEFNIRKSGEVETPSEPVLIRRPGWEVAEEGDLFGAQTGKMYRGMSQEEFEGVTKSGFIKSDGRWSTPEEGTVFSDNPMDAESYTNFGSTDPRKTGKPNYLVEVNSGAAVRSQDGYLKVRGETPLEGGRVWRMDSTEDGSIVASTVDLTQLPKNIKDTSDRSIAGSPGSKYLSPLSLDRKLADPNSAVSPREIVDHLATVSGVPIRKGRGYFGQRKALGWYDPRADEIRTKEALDLTTSYHEFGHAIHDRGLGWDLQNTAPAEVKSELVSLGRELYGDRKPSAGYTREGIAEYVSRVIHGDDPATFAPHTQAWMDLALAQQPEIQEGISRARDLQARWDQQGAFARVASQIDKTPLTISARVKEIPNRVRDFVGNFRKNWINDADLAEKAEMRVIRSAGLKPEDVKPSLRPFSVVQFGLNMSAPGTARRFLEQGAISGHDWSRTGLSLREALAEIPRSDIEDWKVYAYARRAQERYFPQGQNPGISEADANFVVDQWKDRPGFESGAQKFTEVSNLVMDYFQASGGISDDARAIYEAANPIYLPLRRAFEEQGGASRGRGKGEYSGSRPVRGVRGGGEAILDPLEAFARQVEATISLANKLQVRRSIAELAEAFPGNGWFATKIEPPKTATQFKLGEIEADLAKLGLDTSHLSAADKESLLSVFKVANEAPGNENIIDIWRNGEREFWQLDPNVYRATTEMDRESLPGALMSFAAATRMVRLGATGLKGSFSLVTNPLMDSQAWNIFTQKKGFTTPLSAHRGTWLQIKAALDKSVNPHIDRFLNQGGEMTTLMGLDRREAARAVDEALGSQSFRQRFAKSPLQAIDTSHPIDTLRKVFGFFELSPRITEYEAVYNDALAKWGDSREAALAAKAGATDVTLAFTRAGTYARVINRMYPFFTANIAGTDKFFRALSGGMGKKIAAKTVAKSVEWLTLPTILLWAVNKDEKWYQEIPQEEKLRYWHFNLTDDPANRVRLRKPPLLGEIFAGIPEAALERMYRDPASPYTESEVDEAVWAATKGMVPMTNVLDLAPALIKPSIEAGLNRRSFPPGEKIDQTWEETSRLPEDRFNTNTTETAKAIGQLFHISPKRIEVWLSDQTGGLGLELARNAEFLAGMRTMKKTGLGSIPIVGTIFPGSSYNWPKSVKLLGSRLEYLRQVKGSDKLTPELERELEILGGAEGDIKALRQDIRDGVIPETEGHEQITDLARAAWANRKK